VTTKPEKIKERKIKEDLGKGKSKGKGKVVPMLN
jgi:hypothetical protein